MIDLSGGMAGDGCRAEPFAEQHRDTLRAACAEDRDIWAIYANNFAPDGFDASIDTYVRNPNNRSFALFDGEELAGMSSFIGLDQAGKRSRSAALIIIRTCAAPASIGASRT
ncbi:MAG: hypothetical protein M3Q83_04740 [Pseudomonadota bacterium]|nr:hypothetical protein [Pseudomonadota bacterium]